MISSIEIKGNKKSKNLGDIISISIKTSSRYFNCTYDLISYNVPWIEIDFVYYDSIKECNMSVYQTIFYVKKIVECVETGYYKGNFDKKMYTSFKSEIDEILKPFTEMDPSLTNEIRTPTEHYFVNKLSYAKEGPYSSFHSNGKIHLSCYYINDFLDGKYEEYDKNGKIILQSYYDVGKNIRETLEFSQNLTKRTTYKSSGLVDSVECQTPKESKLKKLFNFLKK